MPYSFRVVLHYQRRHGGVLKLSIDAYPSHPTSRMSSAFCLNKNRIFIMAGFGLLFQAIDLDRSGKIIQDSKRFLYFITSVLELGSTLGAIKFKKLVCFMIIVHPPSLAFKPPSEQVDNRREANFKMPTSSSNSMTPCRGLVLPSPHFLSNESAGHRAGAQYGRSIAIPP